MRSLAARQDGLSCSWLLATWGTHQQQTFPWVACIFVGICMRRRCRSLPVMLSEHRGHAACTVWLPESSLPQRLLDIDAPLCSLPHQGTAGEHSPLRLGPPAADSGSPTSGMTVAESLSECGQFPGLSRLPCASVACMGAASSFRSEGLKWPSQSAFSPQPPSPSFLVVISHRAFLSEVRVCPFHSIPAHP